MKTYILDPLGRIFRQPAFVLCTLLLGICAAGMQVCAQKLQWHLSKLPLPLKKPLDQIDSAGIEPYRIVRVNTINEDIEAELGTHDYINAQLEDQSVDPRDPFRQAMLFVTYYTGNPDKVPHVPDVCYVGGGGLMKNAQNTSFRAPNCGAENDRVPVRILTVSIPGLIERQDQRVFYFFAVNGTYRCTRDSVRILQHNLHDRYAYFSKVEVTFPSASAVGADEQFQAAEKLIQVVLPVLYHYHWPDWSAANQND